MNVDRISHVLCIITFLDFLQFQKILVAKVVLQYDQESHWLVNADAMANSVGFVQKHLLKTQVALIDKLETGGDLHASENCKICLKTVVEKVPRLPDLFGLADYVLHPEPVEQFFQIKQIFYSFICLLLYSNES